MSRFVDLVSDIETTMGDSTVTFVVGNDKNRKRGPRRRIHWVRRGGPVVPSSRAGATLVGDDSSGDRVRTPLNRIGLIEAHIFAEDDDTTEDLLDNTIAAIYQTFTGAGGVEFVEYDWDDDQINQRGPYTVLSFSVTYPVSDEIKPLTELTAQEQTCEIETPIP